MSLLDKSIIIGTIADEFNNLIKNLQQKVKDHGGLEDEAEFLESEIKKLRNIQDNYNM